jgi:hypothetical protein
MKVLYQQHWIEKKGIRPAKAHFPSPLYELSVRAQAALTLNKTDLNVFIQTAQEKQLLKLIDALGICP